ncbi:MAG: hypothetical protein GYA21_09145, partial [Myxococcales bacterium]|nr:hypothetical protein [Myxococcales bacterium]
IGLNGGIFIINGQTGAILSSLPSNVEASAIIPPTIVNLDNSGGPEIALVGTCTVQDVEGHLQQRTCSFGFAGDPATPEIRTLWREVSDNVTSSGGVAGFDFEGDGWYELVQCDASELAAFAGLERQRLFSAPRASTSAFSAPVIADTDSDGRAEIVLAQDGGVIPVNQGLLVFGETWAGARRIWNQFDYHITNVRENGVIPRFERPHWLELNATRTTPPQCR